MSFDSQSNARKLQIFRRALHLQEVAAGVFVQKVPASYLKRLYSDDGASDDPVAQALGNLDRIFANCKAKSVDMAASVEGILAEHAKDSKSHGVVLMAWAMGFDGGRKEMRAPKLVGMATVSNFVSTENYSTDAAAMSAQDRRVLQPYFGSQYSYIDCLCSTQPGVGRLLVQHAYAYALARKKRGLVALAYSRRASDLPESKRLFELLHFETLVPRANFNVRMYGTWYVKRDIDLAGMATAAVQVCTRAGLTERTADALMWRCPA